MTRTVDLSGLDPAVDITAGSPEQYPYVSADDQITLGLTDDNTITVSAWDNDYALSSNVSITSIGVPWTTTTATGDTFTLNPNWSNTASSKIKLDGPEADIEINGESLVSMLKQIEQRLNILTPNPELESEWEELRALGEQYRKLEAHIQAKMKTWDAISK